MPIESVLVSVFVLAVFTGFALVLREGSARRVTWKQAVRNSSRFASRRASQPSECAE
jgi:hypothetical protein